MKLDAAALQKDLGWFFQGLAAKFGLLPSQVEYRVTVYDDERGEKVSVVQGLAPSPLSEALTFAEVQLRAGRRWTGEGSDEMFDVVITPPNSTKLVEATVVPTRMHEPGFYVRCRSDTPTWAHWMIRSEEDLEMFRRFCDNGRVCRA